jgi:hypothetical protein
VLIGKAHDAVALVRKPSSSSFVRLCNVSTVRIRRHWCTSKDPRSDPSFTLPARVVDAGTILPRLLVYSPQKKSWKKIIGAFVTKTMPCGSYVFEGHVIAIHTGPT